MTGLRFGSTVAAMGLFLSACGGTGNGNTAGDKAQSPEWEFATSAAVIGISAEALEKRLGKPAFRDLAGGPSTGGLLFDIGGCQVEYAVIEGKVAHFVAKLGQPCQPGLKGVAEMAGVDFAKDRRFGALPAAVTGSWRSDCMGVCPAGIPKVAQFYHEGAPPEAPGLLLSVDTADAAGKVAIDGWIQSLGQQSGNVMAMLCGSIPQDVPSRLMRDVNITKIGFGTHLNPGPRAVCPRPPRLVSLREGGTTAAAGAVADAAASDTTTAARSQIIGIWTDESESCDSDNTVSYNADGTWNAYGAEGSWTFDGRVMSSITTAQGDGDDDIAPLRNPIKSREAVSFTGNERMVSTWQDKSVHRLKRCQR